MAFVRGLSEQEQNNYMQANLTIDKINQIIEKVELGINNNMTSSVQTNLDIQDVKELMKYALAYKNTLENFQKECDEKIAKENPIPTSFK